MVARGLAPDYRRTLELRRRVAASDLDAAGKAGLLLELDAKIEQFQSAMRLALGLDLAPSPFGRATRKAGRSGVHRRRRRRAACRPASSSRSAFTQRKRRPTRGSPRVAREPQRRPVAEREQDRYRPGCARERRNFSSSHAADNAQPTAPYFTRPSIEQPYYDLTEPQWRLRSFAPYPLAAWAEFSFDGLPIRIGQVVQTLQRVNGPGGIYEPLVVTPAIGVRVEPEARILPLDGSRAAGESHRSRTARGRRQRRTQTARGLAFASRLAAQFDLKQRRRYRAAGLFRHAPTEPAIRRGVYSVKAIAARRIGGRVYESGWRSVGYQGLRPYNQYLPAELKTRKVDVKLAPGLRIGYVMGPGDLVPEAIEELGVGPTC